MSLEIWSFVVDVLSLIATVVLTVAIYWLQRSHEKEREQKYIVLGCLMSIYRIRCNMMHGLKIVEQLDDQYELFKAVNGVLESIR